MDCSEIKFLFENLNERKVLVEKAPRLRKDSDQVELGDWNWFKSTEILGRKKSYSECKDNLRAAKDTHTKNLLRKERSYGFL